MIRDLFTLSFGFAVLIAAVQAGHAAPCAPRAQIMARLADTYGETRRGIGLAANNTVMELYAAEATGSWTITLTLPDGQTCLVASGQGYEPLAEDLPAAGAPT